MSVSVCRATAFLSIAGLLVLVAPAPASARPSPSRMVAAINAARAEHGLRPVRVAGPIARKSRSYARQLARHGQFRHARNTRAGGFRMVAEILGLAPGRRPMTGRVVRAWVKSPVHRRILLSPRYRYVGVGLAQGRFGGRPAVFWVARFARR